MNLDYRTKLWRGRNGQLWRLADQLQETAEAVRYANKPYDLVFPITRLTDLTGKVRKMQWEWLGDKLGLEKQDQGQWPHI